MHPTDFSYNPYRHNAFTVFNLDKAETNLKEIRKVIQDTKKHSLQDLNSSHSASDFTVDEAKLNKLEQILLDPVERLQEEQLAHTRHTFAQDGKWTENLQGIVPEKEEMDWILVDMEKDLLGRLACLLPELSWCDLPDDQEWPEAPAPELVSQEPLESVIKRER